MEQAQVKLEEEKRHMQKEHAAQVETDLFVINADECFKLQARQLQEDWRNLTAQQKQKEQELDIKEKELIRRREMLELERRNLLNEVSRHGCCKECIHFVYFNFM